MSTSSSSVQTLLTIGDSTAATGGDAGAPNDNANAASGTGVHDAIDAVCGIDLQSKGQSPLQSPSAAAAVLTATPEKQQSHHDALDNEYSLNSSERDQQRRLGSFELLDAAMANVVEHDPSDDGTALDVADMSDAVNRVDASGGHSSDSHLAMPSPMADNADHSTVDASNVDTHMTEHTLLAESPRADGNDAPVALHLDAAASAAVIVTTVVVSDVTPAVQPTAVSEAQCTDECADVATNRARAPSAPVEPPATAMLQPEASPAAAEPTATVVAESSLANRFAKYEPALLQWIQARQTANDSLPVSQDDVVVFIESTFPELLEPAAALFAWLTHFLLVCNHQSNDTTASNTHKPFDCVADDVQRSAVERLEHSGDLASVALAFGLKSPTTLLYWKYQRDELDRALAATQTATSSNSATGTAVTGRVASVGDSSRRTGFAYEHELLAWVLAHRDVPITRHDIFAYVVTAFPAYAASRTPAALKMWIARFLKRNVSPTVASTTHVRTALPVGDGDSVDEAGRDDETVDDTKAADSLTESSLGVERTVTAAVTTTVSASLESAPPALTLATPATAATDRSVPMAPMAPTQPKRREKRACPNGYVLHSNEFKLNALRQLDAGKTIRDVTTELGLKSPNTLAYWLSIRDKLAVSEKKRFRLAGGGRRSSCSFEDELLTWVAERHQRGQGTDVKAVLDYLRETHPTFTDGKKEPTLRKWILRFFKRCWRTPSGTGGATSNATTSSSSSNDVEKSFIFV